MESNDRFEDTYRSILLPKYTPHAYEKRLAYVTNYRMFEILPIVQPFVPIVKNDHLTRWFHYLRKETDGMCYDIKRKMTSRQKKEQKVLVRYLFRTAKQNIDVLRICDLVLACTNYTDATS